VILELWGRQAALSYYVIWFSIWTNQVDRSHGVAAVAVICITDEMARVTLFFCFLSYGFVLLLLNTSYSEIPPFLAKASAWIHRCIWGAL
jgi:hypothetical protein